MANEKEAAKKEIFDKIEEYYNKFHKEQKNYVEGERIPYASRVYDATEMKNLVDASLDFWLTAGTYAAQFENKLSAYLNIKYCSLVNSGSSANLLAFMSLTSPLLGERAVTPGDEVITVAAGFPTTIAPIVQFGAVPVFVDITIPEYNIDCDQLENAVSDKTKVVMLAHTLGNPFDLRKVKAFCEKHNLWLIEDNCDALGTQYNIDGKYVQTGTIGDIGTSSFYPPHHITMGEGGAVYTNNPLLHKIIRSLRDWGRDCSCPSGTDNLCGHRFDRQYGELPMGYDHKYVYSHFGYNLKATEMQAAIGVAQIDKIDTFAKRRRRNHQYIIEGLKELSSMYILPVATDHSVPSWFGCMITCQDDLDKNKVVTYIENHGVQTRMLFAGNIVKQPCFDSIREEKDRYRIVGNLENTDRVLEQSFWVGVYPGLSKEQLDYMIKILKEAAVNGKR